MKIKTSELTGAALDWAVAKALGYADDEISDEWKYSTDWAQGGEIIDREKISIVWAHFHWCAGTGDIGEIYRSDEGNHFTGTGPTALVAAMHCYVASKLGEEVECFSGDFNQFEEEERDSI